MTCPQNAHLTSRSFPQDGHMFAVLVVAAWPALALGAALLLGSGIRLANRRAPFHDHLAGLPADLTVDDVLGSNAGQPSR